MVKTQPFRRRHIPQRTCIACGETKEKRELIRLVRTSDGIVEVDPIGKKTGRGAYLCPRQECWEAGLKKNRLERALRTKLSLESRLTLTEHSRSLLRGEEV